MILSVSEGHCLFVLSSLQHHVDLMDLQQEYIKDEVQYIKRELLRAQEEVKRIQSVPLVIGIYI